MQSYPFIFSNEKKYRVSRHIVFWCCWWIFFGFLYAAIPVPISYWQRLPAAMIDSILFLGAHAFLSYSLMYLVAPYLLLKGKYLATVVSVAALFLATSVVSAIISYYVIYPAEAWLLPERFVWADKIFPAKFYRSLLGGLRGGITVGGLAVAIKLMKYWYIKEMRNRQLLKENMEAQLQLLTAQIHPHFLFNTLNNIYSFTQNSSPVASKLVLGLSDMLRYILYEGNQMLVPLSKELKMLEEYIALEKVRYGNKLDLHIEISDKSRGLFVAPLLLLPFVENCFKHGTSKILEQPWLNLHIIIQENILTMKLLNGKAYDDIENHKRGIGISNVQKRLELLYPGKHHLSITEEPDIFIVSLKLELEKKQNISPKVLYSSLMPANA